MTDRIPLDELTSDALDRLYAERDAWAAKAEERFQRVLKQSRLLQELKRDNFELRMDLISLLDGRLGDIGPSDIQPGSIRRAALDEHQEQPAEPRKCGQAVRGGIYVCPSWPDCTCNA